MLDLLLALGQLALGLVLISLAVMGGGGYFAHNATLTLGVAALVRPLLAPERGLIMASSLFMIGLLGLFLLMVLKGRMGRPDGAVL